MSQYTKLIESFTKKLIVLYEKVICFANNFTDNLLRRFYTFFLTKVVQFLLERSFPKKNLIDNLFKNNSTASIFVLFFD